MSGSEFSGAIGLRSRDWRASLNTSEHDLAGDFYIPALSLSERFDRGVGFFSAGWLRQVSTGLVAFVENGGRARMITSPILSEDDWAALRAGDIARHEPLLKQILESNIRDLERSLENETLNALAWMIADGVLEMKLALPCGDLSGDFHDKFGIFKDKHGNRISFNGSPNDSQKGFQNYESIKIFWSWCEPLAPFVEADENRFERLWNQNDPNLRIFELDEAARSQILQLRTAARPYRPPVGFPRPKIGFSPPEQPSARDYQRDAINAWFKADGKGILSMATGTGKTFTALLLAHKLYNHGGKLVIVVTCPYVNLANQWIAEMRLFGLDPIPAFEDRRRWIDDLHAGHTAMMLGQSDVMAIVAVNATFLSDAFQNALHPDKLPHLLIADEMHNLGAEKLRTILPDKIHYRLGLSATPERSFDQEGNTALSEYFGGVIFDFPIKEAIRRGYLCHYQYHPIPVHLTDSESEEFLDLSRRIAQCGPNEPDEERRSGLSYKDSLLIKRARVLATAENKLNELRTLLVSKGSDVKKALIYCGDGTIDHGDKLERQIDAVVALSGRDLGFRVRRFTYREPTSEREEILSALRTDALDVIVSIRCLDEGIDLPDVRLGIILASSTNPRQFVQRRGRLLRKAPKKDFAEIYDFIVVPPDFGGNEDDAAFRTERQLFQRELRRVCEFCDAAENGMSALATLRELRIRYNLMDVR